MEFNKLIYSNRCQLYKLLAVVFTFRLVLSNLHIFNMAAQVVPRRPMICCSSCSSLEILVWGKRVCCSDMLMTHSTQPLFLPLVSCLWVSLFTLLVKIFSGNCNTLSAYLPSGLSQEYTLASHMYNTCS